MVFLINTLERHFPILQLPTFNTAFAAFVVSPGIVRPGEVMLAKFPSQGDQAVLEFAIMGRCEIYQIIDDQDRGKDKPILIIHSKIVGMQRGAVEEKDKPPAGLTAQIEGRRRMADQAFKVFAWDKIKADPKRFQCFIEQLNAVLPVHWKVERSSAELVDIEPDPEFIIFARAAAAPAGFAFGEIRFTIEHDGRWHFAFAFAVSAGLYDMLGVIADVRAMGFEDAVLELVKLLAAEFAVRQFEQLADEKISDSIVH